MCHGEKDSQANADSSVTRRPLVIALVAGVAAGAFVWWYYQHYPSEWSDFDQVWLGARFLLAGRDPYVEVPRVFPWPLYYPLPTLLVGVPFAALPLVQARILFAAVSAGICTWAILRQHPHAWPLLLCAPFVYALRRGQWAPLLVAGALMPFLGGIAVAKPSIGLATFAYRPTRAALIGVGLLGLMSLAVQPSWPLVWFAALRNAIFKVVPALLPGGVILLAGIGRWRRADARLLTVLACVPQTPAPYDLFPMALIPATRRQSLIMWLSWNVLYVVTHRVPHLAPLTPADVALRSGFYWPMYLVLGYFPALLAVLTPSPLTDLPRDFAAWSATRQRAYRILWGAVLGLVSAVALLWAVLIVRGS
jgi:hypothetical protein